MADEVQPGAPEAHPDPGANFPFNQSVLIMYSANPGYTSIGLPQAGTVWVIAEGDTPDAIYLWHEGGAMESIPMNKPVSFEVGFQDALVYEFKGVSNPNFKLAWAYE